MMKTFYIHIISQAKQGSYSFHHLEFHNFSWPCQCPVTLFCSIFFVCLFCCCNTVKARDGEKWEALYSSRQWWSLWHTVVTCARKVRGAGKQTDSDTKKYGCSILEKKRWLSPWTGKNTYVVFCWKKGFQEIFNINNTSGNTFKQAKSGGCKKLR